MRGDFLPGRLIFLCVIVTVISGCSVQRPDAAFDSSRSNGKKQSEASAHRTAAPAKEPVRVDYLTLVSELSSPEIYIYKEKRRLYVVQSNVVVRDYPITLGLHPVGDKLKAGDGRTPEGDFFICGKAPSGPKALVIDYPDKAHAQQALLSGVISPMRFKKILLAGELKTPPSPDTSLGGQVSIYALDKPDNEAKGGIELYRSDLQELFKIASVGTPVHIRP